MSEATLAGLPREAMESGAGFAALITGESETSRFHAIHNGLGVDEGAGAAFRAAYRLDLPEGGSLAVEDFGRWFADADGRPCRAHGIVRVVSRAPARRAGGFRADALERRASPPGERSTRWSTRAATRRGRPTRRSRS